jgi:hypothetical protein
MHYSFITCGSVSGGQVSDAKGEIFDEVYGNAIIGVSESGWFQANYFYFGCEVGNVVTIQKGQRRGDGEVEELTGLEGRRVVNVKKASRKADISNNPLALVQFTTLRGTGLIPYRQWNQESAKAPSFHGGDHGNLPTLIIMRHPRPPQSNMVFKTSGPEKFPQVKGERS